MMTQLQRLEGPQKILQGDYIPEGQKFQESFEKFLNRLNVFQNEMMFLILITECEEESHIDDVVDYHQNSIKDSYLLFLHQGDHIEINNEHSGKLRACSK